MSNKISETNQATLSCGDLPKENLSKMNWHGVSSKFSNHYKDRQYKDLGIFKSSKISVLKAAQEYENLLQKKHLQEYDHAQQMLLSKLKKEKAINKRLNALLAKSKILEDNMHIAAIIIQRNIKGYQVRRKYNDQISAFKIKRLTEKIESLEFSVDHCFKYIGNSVTKAAIIIQKNIRKVLAMRKFMKAKALNNELKERMKMKRIIKIQSHIRRFLATKYVKKVRENSKVKLVLENIRKRLLLLKLKEFWNRKKFVWKTIQKKYLEKEENSSQNEESFDDQVSSNIISVSHSKLQSKIQSKRPTVILREPINIEKVIPKPSGPQKLSLKYLQPTKSFVNRVTHDVSEAKTTKVYKVRAIAGKGFQRNTHSRINYISETANITNLRKRASSADYNRKKKLSGQMPDPNFIQELLSSYKQTENPLNTLLKKVEDVPSPIPEFSDEKVYVYYPPKTQCLSFKDALPDVNSLLETYAKNIKNKK